MPPTSRAPSRSRRGFTLVEGVVALAIAAIAVGVTAHALLQTHQADTASRLLAEGGLIVERLRCAGLAETSFETNALARDGWILQASEHQSARGTPSNAVWTAYRLVNSRRPSLEIRGALRQPDPVLRRP